MLSFLSRLHCDSSMFLASLFLHRSRQQLQSQSTSVLKMCTPHEVPPVDISQILVDCEDALYSCCIVCFVEALNLVSSALAQVLLLLSHIISTYILCTPTILT